MAQLGSYPLKPVLDGTEELVAVQGTSTYKFTPEEIRKYGILTGTITKTLDTTTGDFSTFNEFYEWVSGNTFSNAVVELQLGSGTFTSHNRTSYKFGPNGIAELIISGVNSTASVLEVIHSHENDYFIKANKCKLNFNNIKFLNSGVSSTSFIELSKVNATVNNCIFDKFNTALMVDKISFVDVTETTFNSPINGTTSSLINLQNKSSVTLNSGTIFTSSNNSRGMALLADKSSFAYIKDSLVSGFFVGVKAENNARIVLNDSNSIIYSGNTANESPARNLIQRRGEFISDGTADLEFNADANEPMILEVTIDSSNTSVDMSQYDSGMRANIDVDWGDGYTTKTRYPYEDDTLYHKYVDPGVYEIKITGELDYLYINDYIYNYLTDIKQWGNLKIRYGYDMFYDCDELTHVTANDGWDLSTVSDMGEFFAYCYNLKSINVTNWNVSNTANMKNLFGYCYELETVTGLETWDTGNVRTMYGMFYDCYKLKNLDVSNFNTSNVRTFYEMFYGCYELEYLDVSNWDVSNCTSFDSTFQNCYKLKDLNVSNWDVSRCNYFGSMFRGSYNVNPDVSRWKFGSYDDLGKTISVSYMFQNATSANPDISGWNVENINNFSNFLDGSAFSTENYDKMLIAWAKQDVQYGLSFYCSDTQYSGDNPEVVRARSILENDHNWTFYDAGSTTA